MSGCFVAVANRDCSSFGGCARIGGFSYDLYGENPSLAQSLGISGNRVIVNSLLILRGNRRARRMDSGRWAAPAGLRGDRIGHRLLRPRRGLPRGRYAGLVCWWPRCCSAPSSRAVLAMQSSEGIPASLSDIIQALLLLGFSIRYAPQIIRLTRRVMANFTLIGKRRT